MKRTPSGPVIGRELRVALMMTVIALFAVWANYAKFSLGEQWLMAFAGQIASTFVVW